MPRRTYGPNRRRPHAYDGAALHEVQAYFDRRRARPTIEAPAPKGPRGPRHTNHCPEPDISYFRGSRGDQMAHCRNCMTYTPVATTIESETSA